MAFFIFAANMYPSSKEIKQQFLDFFASKGHKIVPSAPIVVKGDPTLMFTNAGMNQFKDYFLGNEEAPEKRIADSQKCLRVSGKHNDLDEVGHDHYHHTMFEMLGNWSFGNYFKKEAIQWAWELLTEVYGLSKEQLYVSVFEGDDSEGLPFDKEAYDIWKELIDESHIVHGNKKDNFWEMGETGPCGPCSEIHIDLRSESERKDGKGKELVNSDHPEVIEIWNNVFMEFNRMADGKLVNLPQKHVDTGMGFERLVRVIQEKKSNYDTDVFSYIIEKTESLSNQNYGKAEVTDIAFRVIADHIRAVAMIIADGQLPSNNGAGYVARRILRRAVRYGYSYLNFDKPFLNELVPELSNYFKESFPEVDSQSDFIQKVIREEEISFFRTLSQGISKLTEYFNSNSEGEIPGSMAFELYDTFGFPIDLTELIAREKGYTVDLAGFQEALNEQKQRSKADAKKDLGDWNWMVEDAEENFVGYDQTKTRTRITRWRSVEHKGKKNYQMILENSPFYAESGGQIGDAGELLFENGETIAIHDTQKENKLHILATSKEPTSFDGKVEAKVSERRRQWIACNHSATHLLHSALRSVLGDHVAQKGSLVTDKSLRFDFSHFGKMSADEIKEVETIVNQKIRAGINLIEHRNMPIEEAKKMGAMALFGEKYGEFVRVIVFDQAYSVELCGGTHVANTSEINLFKITSEGSISSGVRRIEAITSDLAWKDLNQKMEAFELIIDKLQRPKDLVQSIDKLLEQQAQLKKKVESFELQMISDAYEDLKSKAQIVDQKVFLIEKLSLPHADAAKQICFQLKDHFDSLCCVLGYVANEKPGIAIYIDPDLVEANDWNASKMVRELGKHIQGGGGGQDFFATAGGKNTDGLATALEAARALLLN